jgi:hypothetical protein
MKTFVLQRPPETPGVYILRNTKTLQVYVGCTANLRRRFMAWWSGAHSKAGIPEHVLRIFKASPPEDWEFVVVKEGTRQDRAELARDEASTIGFIAGQHPERLLNRAHNDTRSTAPVPKLPMSGLPRAAGTGRPKSDLRAEDGRQMTYVEAASILNISAYVVKKRLRLLREKGVVQVAVGDLT